MSSKTAVAWRNFERLSMKSGVSVVIIHGNVVVGRIYVRYGRSAYGVSCRGAGVLFSSFPGLDSAVVASASCRGAGYDMKGTVIESIIRSWADQSSTINDRLKTAVSRSEHGISGLGFASMLGYVFPDCLIVEA